MRSSADGLSAGCSTVNIAATCRSSCRGCASVQDRALVPLREGCKVYRQSSRFPETPTTSLDVLQPWPLPSSRLVSPEIRHDHIPPLLRTTCRTAAASPRTIPRHAGAQINRAAGHAVIWCGTLGVRRDSSSTSRTSCSSARPPPASSAPPGGDLSALIAGAARDNR